MKFPNSIRRILYAVLFIYTVTACNPTKHMLSKTHKQYEKQGLEEWTSENDSSSIVWRKVGSGEQKLLLFHGFGAATELQWKKVVKLLAKDFTIYIPDLIYFGESTSKKEIYDPRFIARQLYRSLPKESQDSFYVAGISFGGLISSIFAHNYPQNTKGLILIDALSIFADTGHTDSLAKAYGYENISELLIPDDGKALKTMLKVSFYNPKIYPAFVLNKPAEILYGEQRAEKEKLLQFMSKHAAAFRTLDLRYDGPVEIIWGREDKIIPLSDACLLDEYYPNSTLTVLPKVGHVANMESPKEVAGIIRKMAAK